EPDDVQARDAVIPLLEDERGDVLGGRTEPAEHRQAADPHALLDRGMAGEDAGVFEDDVAAQERPVDQGAAVADAAVVADVGADHEQVAVADPGLALALDGAPVDGDVLAEDVAVADAKGGRLAEVALMLGALAQHGAVALEVVPAEGHGAAQAAVRPDHPPPAAPH